MTRPGIPSSPPRPVLSWGRAHRFRQGVVDARAMDAALASTPAHTLLPFGAGRSYGDSCLNEGGLLLDTRGLDRFVSFDSGTGVLVCESGVTLRDILLLCAARPNADGSFWFLPVTPGTKFATVGGAIANDVHGKNHHRQGSFGEHVEEIRLRRSDDALLACSPAENAELFRATIGGLGLTGLIEQATLRLMRVPGMHMAWEELRLDNLDAFYALTEESEKTWDYTVAWIDCLAQGKDVGRGIFSRGRHVEGAPAARDVGNRLLPRLSVPFAPPFSPLNRLTLGAFNALYRNKLMGAAMRTRRGFFDPFFYPLDSIGRWNLMYGPRGFYQYQCALPPDAAGAAVREQLETIARAGEGSFLIVLKTFGDRPASGLMSFPMKGTTLALDFPNRGASTLALLDRLDAITLAADGRVFPAKDGRMAAAAFQRYYPQWRDFARHVDPRFSSSFWRRVTADSTNVEE